MSGSQRRIVYMDHAATTPMDARVAERLLAELAEPLNASSVHRAGQRARAMLEEAREELAALLGVRPGDVVFTASATEANNLAIRGIAEWARRTGVPITISLSMLEHACVRGAAAAVESRGGAALRWLDVTEEGRAVLPTEARPGTELLCLMAVQNETGVVQELEAARLYRDENAGVTWLCDVTQAVGTEVGSRAIVWADLASMSSHKIYGPAGVGALVGRGLRQVIPQLAGGPQEHELRAGTQPVALIRGFVHAVRLAMEERVEREAQLRDLTQLLMERLAASAPQVRLNGKGAAPGFLNLSAAGFRGADLVIALDARGFCTSSGSACATGVMEASPALLAMFPSDPERAEGALRVTLGKETRRGDVEAFAEALIGLIIK